MAILFGLWGNSPANAKEKFPAGAPPVLSAIPEWCLGAECGDAGKADLPGDHPDTGALLDRNAERVIDTGPPPAAEAVAIGQVAPKPAPPAEESSSPPVRQPPAAEPPPPPAEQAPAAGPPPEQPAPEPEQHAGDQPENSSDEQNQDEPDHSPMDDGPKGDWAHDDKDYARDDRDEEPEPEDHSWRSNEKHDSVDEPVVFQPIPPEPDSEEDVELPGEAEARTDDRESRRFEQDKPSADPLEACGGWSPYAGNPNGVQRLPPPECVDAINRNPDEYRRQVDYGPRVTFDAMSELPGWYGPLGALGGAILDALDGDSAPQSLPNTEDEAEVQADDILEDAPQIAALPKKPDNMSDAVWAKIQAGNQFNAERRPFYDYDEVITNENRRIDSYNPGEKIVERKYTQFATIKPETGLKYLRETYSKYAPKPDPYLAPPEPGTMTPRIVADKPSNRAKEQLRVAGGKPEKPMVGELVTGDLIVEVPVQKVKPGDPLFPDYLVAEAEKLNMQVCDIEKHCTPPPDPAKKQHQLPPATTPGPR